jgi:hypothetical protein
MRRQPDPRLVEMWREIGESIQSGDIQGLFVVWEHGDRELPAGVAFRAVDPTALLEHVRSHALRVRHRLSN